MGQKDDFFITTLKSIRQQTLESNGVSNMETRRQVRFEHPTMSEEMFERFYNHAAEHVLYSPSRFMMKVDAYFQLLEYEALQEARASSQKAQDSSRKAEYLAIGALLVSSMIGIASIVS